MAKSFVILLLLTLPASILLGQTKKPLRIGIAGLTHTHVHWLLGRPQRGDVQIAGIAEPNKELALRYTQQHGLSMDIVYNSFEEMISKAKPEAVTAFGTTYQHLQVVQTCAPLGIHVMVEKPLAVSLDHARQMKQLAEKHNILLLTNYETTWYATNHKAYSMVNEEHAIGPLRKIVVHDGHQGPKEIGVNKEFLDWLTDPVQNGGGAITDFGCYGANLVTWLAKGERPLSVQAMTQQLKPSIYPKVDDEATILLQYPSMQGIIQASWNWPFSRKDMELYGRTGYILADNRTVMRTRLAQDKPELKDSLRERQAPYDDPFAFFAALVRKEISMPAYDLSSLENNMIVVEILEAAKESAKTGRAVQLAASSALTNGLDSIFQSVFKADEPGGAVLLVKDNKVIYKKGFGVADIKTKEPITTNTLFNVGSISKTFVAYGILRLAKEGKLSLDDNLYKYFPDFKNADIARKVKLYHLLTHTSGLPDSRQVSKDSVFYLTAKDEENWAPIKQTQRLNFEPGSQFQYSNPAFNGLALIIEKVSGRKWQQYLADIIFRPAGMEHSTITDGPHPRSGVSHGYVVNEKGAFKEQDYGEEPTFAASGNGGVWSSVEELWKYEQAIQKNIFLDAEWINRSRAVYPFNNWAGGQPSFMGLSWFLTNQMNLSLIGHTGSQGGFISDYLWIPEKKVFYVLLCNTPKSISSIRAQIFNVLFKTQGE